MMPSLAKAALALLRMCVCARRISVSIRAFVHLRVIAHEGLHGLPRNSPSLCPQVLVISYR